MDPQTEAILQEIVRRESRSLLLYIGDAFPWTTSDGEGRLAALRQAVREVREAVVGLGRFLVKQRVTPTPLGSFPSSFTSWNFVSLSFLVPKLLEAEQASIAALEGDQTHIQGQDSREAVAALLAAKKNAARVLEGLREPQGAVPAGAV